MSDGGDPLSIFRRGAEAFLQGKGGDQNPHEAMTRECAEWNRGHWWAYAASDANPEIDEHPAGATQ